MHCGEIKVLLTLYPSTFFSYTNFYCFLRILGNPLFMSTFFLHNTLAFETKMIYFSKRIPQGSGLEKKESKMKFPQIMGLASILAMSSTMAFAWSISGKVQSAGSGRALAGVTINSFNYAGIAATTAEDGSFSINSESDALFGIASAKMSANIRGGIFSLDGVNAHQLKISAINALGKVIFQRSFYEINGSVSIDLAKVAGHGANFVRVTADGSSQTYIVKGKNALLKEGEPLPSLMFALEGYQSVSYTMSAEVETDVIIKMERGSTTPPSSSSVVNPGQSSSSVEAPTSSEEAKSSASQDPVPVDCSGKTARPVQKQQMSVTVDGKKRTFLMHIPDAYKGDKPVPLVVDYHPVMGNGEGQYNGTTYKSQTDPEGVISLYPDGTKSADSRKMGPGWNVGPCCSDDDDVKFSRAMIDAVKEIACIDPQRIYATGFSMGGGMSNHVACFMSDVFAAVAPAGMDLNTTNSAKCNPERPISVINFRGTNDGTCRYQGGDSGFNDGLNFLGAEGTFRFWAEKNGCTGSPSKNSNGCDEYSNCKDGVKVVLCTKQGGGHEQGDGKIGWPFLKQFTLPASFVK